jgi:hypothetical protein
VEPADESEVPILTEKYVKQALLLKELESAKKALVRS